MAFSYTYTITVNTPEDWNKVNQNFADVKTVLNNGITGTDHLSPSAAIADTQLAAPNNATYKQILASGVTNLEVAGTGTYILSEAGVTTFNLQAGSNSGGGAAFYLDPADYTAGTKTNKYRLRASILTNATAPTSTFTVGLYPVTASAGGAGANTITLGAVTAGSTCAFVAPAGSSAVTPVSSGDFTAPAAGYYALAVVVSVAGMVGSSSVVIRGILQHRQV